MIATIGRAATILALCLSLGLHWLALQSVAWTTMLVANARHVSLTQAVAQTFDGQHPCVLCHVVADGKKSDKNSEILPTIAKIDLICQRRMQSYLPAWTPYQYLSMTCAIGQRDLAPLVPPPRFLG